MTYERKREWLSCIRILTKWRMILSSLLRGGLGLERSIEGGSSSLIYSSPDNFEVYELGSKR
jgi:hypothetical protein